jgi:cell division protein FtsL
LEWMKEWKRTWKRKDWRELEMEDATETEQVQVQELYRESE